VYVAQDGARVFEHSTHAAADTPASADTSPGLTKRSECLTRMNTQLRTFADETLHTRPEVGAEPEPLLCLPEQGDGGGEVSSLADVKSSLGDDKSSPGDAESSPGDAESSLGDAESSLVDDKSSLGDVKSSLGDGKKLAR
jgi:hypothetical protein